LAKRLAWLDGELSARPYLLAEGFSAADCYAFVVLNWSGLHQIDLSPYPNLQAYMARIGARPAVQQALKEEGLA
jgi:glutathione S-transferase